MSHRGWWQSSAEQNQASAFERSFAAGYGTETDLRDYLGKLVISHDPADATAMQFSAMLMQHFRLNPRLPLALNVKADGLVPAIVSVFNQARPNDYFFFDMSGPETLRYASAGLCFFSRQSDIEPEPILYDKSSGVWLDAFERDWLEQAVIERHLERGKRVCVVSPELHRRSHLDFWTKLARMTIVRSSRVLLCTDLPEEARRFFPL